MCKNSVRVSTHFNLYAAPWADAIMQSIQNNILEVIRRRAEISAPPVPMNPEPMRLKS